MYKNIQWFVLMLSLSLFFAGCTKFSEPNLKETKAKDSIETTYNDKSYRVDEKSKVEIGIASYYARCMNGRRTASGEICDLSQYTAAHRTLPLGTIIRVTMLNNGKSVMVKVNDRGSYAKGRVVDLSLAAAKKIGLIRAGVAKVKIEKMKKIY